MKTESDYQPLLYDSREYGGCLPLLVGYAIGSYLMTAYIAVWVG